jgi:dihydrofolate reductase
VATHDLGFTAPGVIVAHSVDDALAAATRAAARLGVDEIMVIGGAEIYRQTMARADRLYITEVDLAPQGDVFFPPIDENRWREVRREAGIGGPRDEADFALVDYVAKNRGRGGRTIP